MGVAVLKVGWVEVPVFIMILAKKRSWGYYWGYRWGYLFAFFAPFKLGDISTFWGLSRLFWVIRWGIIPRSERFECDMCVKIT